MLWDLVMVAAVLLVFAGVSGRLARTPLTAPITFVGLGLLLGDVGLDVLRSRTSLETVRVLSEVTLALVLFADASAIRIRALVREAGPPVRLLGLALPMTIALGALLAWLMLPGLDASTAVLLAVLLAPTDAALGQVVVADRRLPSRLRQGLNVESGLNDGICVPLLFAALALVELQRGFSLDSEVAVDLATEVGVATVVGVAVALLSAGVARAAARMGWTDSGWAQVMPLAAVALAYAATVSLGGSGFIAAFVAGLLYGGLRGPEVAHETTRLLEEVGGVASAVTFFAFGAVVVGATVDSLDLRTVLYAVLSLTVVRMLPVALAFVGSGAALPTVLFAGWFGPRGLATIVFALIVLERSEMGVVSPAVAEVATVTVLLSVLAHGVTAAPLTERYVDWFARTDRAVPLEREDVERLMEPRRRRAWSSPPS
jgi:NhaP-type Na+/H+ or K+/H+ antiporter